ncbi:Sister chromatid cohesion 1 protein 3 [Spatholobus suberectus]|nr:Sister chromatid cohesion 1 protein 3 [Spatholobus suberectus]
MFYSQTFLARKGPLSTVWIAAHLQHRLKKSHYTTTDIPSTVLRIMDPGVPIALRMSGHLLLGVVRIYSKKVEYLHQDCKDVLTTLHKAFATLQPTHPEEARPAPFQSVTLPGTFDLDAQNIDDQIDHNESEDLHLRNPEEITLADRIPVTMDHYVTVSFDEDIMMDSSPRELLPDFGAMPMEEDIPSTNVVGAEDHGPSTQTESPTIQQTSGLGPTVHSPPQATQVQPTELRRDANIDYNQANPHSPLQATQVESTELCRDANNDYNQENPLVFPNFEDNDAETNRVLDQTANEKDHVHETICDLDHEGMSVPSQQHFNPATPPTSQGGTSDAQACGVLENNFTNLELRESPPKQKPQRRGRKRKQFIDESIVLTNRFMRNALNNPCDILRKRRDVPSSSLGTWKLNNSRRKEHIFDQPLLTGFGKDLLDISKSEYVCSRPHLVISEEDHADARMAEALSPTNQVPEEPIAATNQPPEESIAATNQTSEEPIAATNQASEEPIAATSPVTAFDMEIEHIRNVAVTPPPTVPAHNVVEGDYMSPDRRDDLTMASPLNGSFASLGTNIASERMQTLDLAASPGGHGSETMRTPDSDTHDLINSVKTDEFWFLKLDSNTPASSQGTSGTNKTLSERTKHTAQYLERLSSITPILEEPAGDLCLNKILKGKTRHVAARMFFEVLVLKTNGLVDVQQEQPYGDISLKLAPTLSNAQS